jgi:hypothetical protein
VVIIEVKCHALKEKTEKRHAALRRAATGC